MSDWEEAIEFELDNSFIMTRVMIITLQQTSTKLRTVSKWSKNSSCNAIADRCDIVSEKLMTRMYRKLKV